MVLQEGHRQSFNVLLDHYELDFGKIGATLERVSPSAYWYFQDGVRFEEDDLDRAVQALEERIIPALAAGFGPLWPPDAPPGQRITILNAPSRGLAGYYSSADEYPAVVHQNSNEQKMILMNPTNLGVGSVDYLSTLAHELQHAVNWNVNGGQSSWLNEGLSQVAEHRMGWEPWSVPAYIHSAPVSVVYWPITPGGRAPNYGASFLFTQFMLDQLGSPANLAPLIKTGQRGENAVTAYLRSLGSGETFESLFGRWTVASYLGRQGEGPYDYADSWPPAFSTDTLDSHGSLAFWQPQYSARYIRLDTDAGGLEVSFSGQAQAPILPVEPASGGRCWWGNRDDGMSTTLTRGFDLTGVESATLEFSMWHEIEEGWDYAYVMVSRDGGVTWDILQGGRSSLENPSQNAYGPGYTGTTDGWVEDSVDLSPYAGAEVLVRFHYVTDDAANGVGICIDSVSIPDLDFHDDASTNLGWTSNGFFRADNRTAQGFTVHLIETKGGESVVTPVLLNDANAGAVRVSDLSALDEAVLVVGSLAPHSSQPARYVVTLAKAE